MQSDQSDTSYTITELIYTGVYFGFNTNSW